MELTRDQLLEIIDANGGNLDAIKIPIDTIPEDIEVPGVLKVASDGNIRRIPAIKVGELEISSDLSREERRTIEIADGFQARNITIICHDNVVFGDNVKITENLDIRRSSHITFGDNLFVGREIIDYEGEVEFGRRLRVGDCISVSPSAGSIRISEYSEVGFLHAPKPNSSGQERYPNLRAGTIERLPAHSKFYCHVSGLAPGTQIDERVYIAGNLYWGHGLSGEDKSDNLPVLKHALHIDGCLTLSGWGAEFFIPNDSRIGTLDITDDEVKPIHLQLGTNVEVMDWSASNDGGYILDSIPSQFKTRGKFCCDARKLNAIASDAYFGGKVVMRECLLEHWPIRHNNGDLDLSRSKVRTLEPGATVNGDLVLDGSDIEELVYVDIQHDLHICSCSHLRSLHGVIVRGTIYIDTATPIQALQYENLVCCCGVDWKNTPAFDGTYYGVTVAKKDFNSLIALFDLIRTMEGAYVDRESSIRFRFR